jgi:hypothetical protein
MTKNHGTKKKVRERMAQTGERYTAARDAMFLKFAATPSRLESARQWISNHKKNLNDVVEAAMSTVPVLPERVLTVDEEMGFAAALAKMTGLVVSLSKTENNKDTKPTEIQMEKANEYLAKRGYAIASRESPPRRTMNTTVGLCSPRVVGGGRMITVSYRAMVPLRFHTLAVRRQWRVVRVRLVSLANERRKVEVVPGEFGNLTLLAGLCRAGERLEVTVRNPWRRPRWFRAMAVATAGDPK